MKKSESILKWLALVPAALLILSLSYGLLNSSDFPLGIVGPPDWQHWDKWSDFAQLNQNQVWNYRGTWNDSVGLTLADYLNTLHDYGLKVVLEKATWNIDKPNADSIPYFIEYYSQAQYLRMEAEVDSDSAQYNLALDHTGYFFMNQKEGGIDPQNPGTWFLSADTCYADTVISGPYETTQLPWKPQNQANMMVCYGEPCFNWPMEYHYDVRGRSFMHTIQAKANLSGQNPNTVVFKMYLDYYNCYHRPDPLPDLIWFPHKDSLIVKVSDFGGSPQMKQFSFIAPLSLPVDSCYQGMVYKVYWPGYVDLWVDYIEYMDMNAAYPLFVNNASQDSTLNVIYQQCLAIEQNDVHHVIVGWHESDEPRRPSFTAHGLINDYLIQRGIKTPQTIENPLWSHDYMNLVHRGKLPVLIEDYYRIMDTCEVGDQTELQMFSDSIEVVYQAATDVDIPFYAMVQAHWNAPSNPGAAGSRDPAPSEIFAQAYMALAHGAKGIWVYKYSSYPPKSFGLVDSSYNHINNDSIKFDDKWNAVKNLYAQLDSIGDILLTLHRDAAYCCTSPNYQSPVTGIQFFIGGLSYIEVGQFHDNSGNDYLIVVNRRTDVAQNISISTDKMGLWVLRDLYTQERFLSSTGNFKAIPFTAGQGRVFKFETFNNSTWTNSDRIVLADTVFPERLMLWTYIDAGTTIKATAEGLLRMGVNAALDCNGTDSDSVIFDAIDDWGWQGIHCIGRGVDSLMYVAIKNVKLSTAALNIQSNRKETVDQSSDGLIGNCLI
ncbi:MAG: hypothetical protein NTW14_14915 [bacterium]|nr:hypothetical protein [bacterium]